MIKKELHCEYGYQKSFYGKAYTLENDIIKQLYSYDTLIATINKKFNTVEFTQYSDYSSTTVRHVNDFLRQNGLLPQKVYIKGKSLDKFNMNAMRLMQDHIVNVNQITYI